jgi:hypothetical protein
MRALLVTAVLGVAASGCVADNHPLATSGRARFLLDDSPLFAADVLDENGRPVLPRQDPYSKFVQLQLTVSGAPDRGGFVDVQMTPPGKLLFVPVDETCEELDGAFRCTAADDGYANFMVVSESDFSGQVTLSLTDRDEPTAEIQVLPAGLPADTPSFNMLFEGGTGSTIPARFDRLACSIEPTPPMAFDKWPPGAIRVREGEVRAQKPPTNPGVVDHAPVIIQSLSPEAFVTLDPTCADEDRKSLIRVQLDQDGVSPKFYFCFSDIGGNAIELSFASGALVTEDDVVVDVEPEPRLLRVQTLVDSLFAGDAPTAVAAVSAFDANLDQLPVIVDVASSDDDVIRPTDPTVQLLTDPGVALEVFVEPLAAGSAVIQVTPQLHSKPVCSTTTIVVN